MSTHIGASPARLRRACCRPATRCERSGSRRPSSRTSGRGRTVVRVGSCGALTEALALRDLVIASGACTDSSMNRVGFEGRDYARVADFELLRAAHDAFTSRNPDAKAQVRLIFSSDSFYSPRPELMQRMVGY